MHAYSLTKKKKLLDILEDTVIHTHTHTQKGCIQSQNGDKTDRLTHFTNEIAGVSNENKHKTWPCVITQLITVI